MSDLDELIQRLEQATGYSINLNEAVWAITRGYEVRWRGDEIEWLVPKCCCWHGDHAQGESHWQSRREITSRPGVGFGVPNYTGSLDDALTLVPEGAWLDIKAGTQKSAPSWEWPVVEIGDQDTGDTIWKGQAKTLPLALCIASLKARKAAERVT